MEIRPGGIYEFLITGDHYQFKTVNVNENDEYIIHLVNIKTGGEDPRYGLLKFNFPILWKPVSRIKLLAVRRVK